MSLILDCSVTLAFLLDDERSGAIEKLFEKVAYGGAVVPSLWHLEVANSLNAAVRRRRITDEFRDQALADLSVFEISVDTETHLQAWQSTANLAASSGLTVYDAAYLELAQRKRLALATLDQPLARAASAFGVVVIVP
jgi:predicted nucleic acid-binding protein